MKVVFMGTPDFSVGTLEAIIAAGHEVTAVVTQPDKPKGRGGAVSMSAVKEAACKHDLTVLQPVKARNPEFIELLRTYEADVIVVVAFGQILPSEILHMPKYGCVNVHASLLPKYRGASPIQWAVIDGCEYSGVTTMQMDEGVDTGDILLMEKVRLNPKETGGSLFDRLSAVGADLLVKTLDGLENNTIVPVKQQDEEATHVKMLSKAFGEIDFTKDAVQIERLIRGLNPWPSAFTHMEGKMLKIWDATVLADGELSTATGVQPGCVIKADHDELIVKCGTGALLLNEIQLEGKKKMPVDAFLRGCKVPVGLLLGNTKA
jgi:methionyl-tRNA formyltransferase